MSKPYTADDFSNLITADRTWRIREISDLKTAIRSSDKNLGKVLLRALVTIAYAHWEGHVRQSARLYLTHVALRKHPYATLDSQFLKNYFLPRLAALSLSRGSVESRCNLLDEIFSSSNKQFSRVNDDLINTRSNLNSEVLREICIVCGVSYFDFIEYESFIDAILLKRRNSIAHGEDTFIAREDLDDVAEKTISLMRLFGDTLDNQVQLKQYMAA